MSKPAVEGNVRQVIQDLQRRVAELERRDSTVSKLSELSPDIGLIQSGEFRSGNGVEPGDGFSGVRMNAAGVSGYLIDVLQAQMSATDGKLTAGAGAAIADVSGYGIHLPTGASSWEGRLAYKFYDSDGNVIADLYDYSGSLVLENIETGKTPSISLRARAEDDQNSSVSVSAQRLNSSIPPAYFSADLSSAGVGAVEISAGNEGTITLGRSGSTTDTVLNSTISMGNTYSIKGGTATLANNTATSFTPTTARGVLILRGAGAQNTEYAMITYVAIAGTAYAYSWVNGTNTEITTGALAGTTGTDVKVTISAHTDGKIYIENRRGGSRSFAWQIVAGV